MRLSGSNRGAAVLAAVVAIGLVVAGVAVGVPAAAELQQPSGDEIIEDVEQRYDEAETVTGTAEITVTNDSETKAATVDFATKEPDKFRIAGETDDGESFEAGSNGSVGWFVGEDNSYAREIPAEGDHHEYHENGDHHGMMTDPVGETVDAELVDTTEIDGEEAYVVELTPTEEATEDHHNMETTLWVSTEDSRVLQVTASDDSKEVTAEITETEFDVSVHDSTFEPPEDRVSVTSSETYESFEDLEASTDLPIPSYDDGEFEEATHFTSADGEAVIQEYETDDGEVQVITATGAEDRLSEVDDGERVTVDGEDATAVDRDDRTVVFWTDEDVTTGVVVDGSVDDAVAVAEAIR
ncbi:outer membrane lipoprotein-sorting protein [Halohasta litchfieldiae]|jgi:outer membrane lipoprotein-sorting protein|uniref:Outer membrane lipoprotein-sorting protein n=1 Tax=Halohasta litchfieldiae TaxID=1073996 RepID=A0A1H6UTP9_9EURY|nr:outer membrane lipoprotein carrier protein LolA [Halohasta litchfieldiae]ATW88370.1 outer membrane lipoprotein-sorting protein [Halohasta litchfieldiae]SEI95783.1 Outer membrane lipoprotein-sorting protein [Halohasta litchfieldiae]